MPCHNYLLYQLCKAFSNALSSLNIVSTCKALHTISWQCLVIVNSALYCINYARHCIYIMAMPCHCERLNIVSTMQGIAFYIMAMPCHCEPALILYQLCKALHTISWQCLVIVNSLNIVSTMQGIAYYIMAMPCHCEPAQLWRHAGCLVIVN